MKRQYNGFVIFGGMGTGKDTLVDQIEKFIKETSRYNIGMLCRELMKVAQVNPKWRGLERPLSQNVADHLRAIDPVIMCDYVLSLLYLRWKSHFNWDNSNLEGEEYKEALLSQLSMITDHELPIIVGGRTMVDYEYWKDKNFMIIGIKADEDKVRERLIKRDGLKVAQNSSTAHNTEKDVSYIVDKLCHIVIDNNGTIEDLENATKKLLDKYWF